MTRENKLALVIGFGLILFVGILISDHLSAAKRQDTADFTAGHQPAAANWEEYYDLQDYGPAGLRTAGHMERPVEPSTELVADRANTQAIGTNEWTIPTPDIKTATTPGMPEVPTHEPAASGAGGALLFQATNPLYTTHVVANGESLGSISRKYYGDESLVMKIAKLNNMSNPHLVRAGDKLKLPSAGLVNMVNAVKNQPIPPTRSHNAANTPGAGQKTYTIKPGDVLSTIASRQMGSARLWRKLYDHNRDVLNDPHNIPAGVTIRIP